MREFQDQLGWLQGTGHFPSHGNKLGLKHFLHPARAEAVPSARALRHAQVLNAATIATDDAPAAVGANGGNMEEKGEAKWGMQEDSTGRVRVMMAQVHSGLPGLTRQTSRGPDGAPERLAPDSAHRQ